MKYLDNNIKNRLEGNLRILESLRPLPEVAVKKLREQFQMEMTYNTNAIEGNSLTLKETFLVISEGITVKGKPLKDHLEAKDQYEALNFLFSIVDQKNKPQLTESLVRDLHKIVVQKTDKEWAGRYRNGQVIITGAEHRPPDAIAVPNLMQDLILWINKNVEGLHPVELAALLHHKVVFIHPFFDGNGRTARLLMNIILMRAGYPLSIILKNDRPKYYRSLQQADKGNFNQLVKLVAQSVERTLGIYLKTLLPISDNSHKYSPLAQIAKKFGFSGKHLNLLARQGKIQAYKEKRNWVTTENAVLEYMKTRKRNR